MIDDFVPEPQPSGALVPPPRNPPTAIATAAPLPPRNEPRIVRRGSGFRGLVETALDTIDTLGDTIAEAVGLR